MAYNLKEVIANKPSRFTAGHRMCAGCGAPVVGRMILRALKEDDHAVICNATGCMEVSTFLYPYTAWTDSFIHTAFENAAATLSGVEAAYKSMKATKKYPDEFIPITLLVVGAVIAPLVVGQFDASTVVMGAISGWASVGLNQTIKQLGKSE